ncbi:MAG: diphthine synthase, partial [Nanoarchaeota archaeon]|nr:diphthine synthase [Nanoarchaeota archaeon]
MTLYMIGIGLNDAKDITLKGLEIIKKCAFVYLESYTSLLQCPIDDLEELYGRKIIEADREYVEKKAGLILDKALDEDVAFLVIGDVFGATTHTDLFLRAEKEGVDIEVINNASVLNAVGIVGLELYKYGKVTSIPYPMKGFNPLSFYGVLEENLKIGAHTLLLLDIKADEAQFMTVNEGISRLIEAEENFKKGIISWDTKAIGIARLGGKAKILPGTLK